MAFVASRHPLAKRKHLEWENLRTVGFIIRKEQRGSGTSQEYIQHVRKIGFRPKVIMCCDTATGVKEAVRRKMGVGVLYRDVIPDNIRRHEFKTLNLPRQTFEGKSYTIYHKNRPGCFSIC